MLQRFGFEISEGNPLFSCFGETSVRCFVAMNCVFWQLTKKLRSKPMVWTNFKMLRVRITYVLGSMCAVNFYTWYYFDIQFSFQSETAVKFIFHSKTSRNAIENMSDKIKKTETEIARYSKTIYKITRTTRIVLVYANWQKLHVISISLNSLLGYSKGQLDDIRNLPLAPWGGYI